MLDIYEIGNKLPFGILVVDIRGKIQYRNSICLQILSNELNDKKFIQEIFPRSVIIKAIKEGQLAISEYNETILLNIPIITGELGMIFFLPKNIHQELINRSRDVIDLKQELEAIMNLNGELVTITDANGIVLRVSNACEKILGVKEHDFIGKSALIMEKKGVIKPSSTKYVIENKRKITMNQVTQSGRRLIVHAHPIFKDDGSLHKVINISKDVTEIENLQKKLEETKSVLDYYQQELRILKKKDQEMIFKSKAMETVYELACRVADVDATIFIHGETGVGKEVLARTIHNLSIRENAPFVKINCAAIPESIIESELFGYAKGTFTGANKDGKKGLALAAHKGTLFLDEIGELPLSVQAKLLQLLQEKKFTPLGETKPVEVDVRFIAATNRNLEVMVKEGTFREDLYYRLFVVPITIPPLSKERRHPFLSKSFFRDLQPKI